MNPADLCVDSMLLIAGIPVSQPRHRVAVRGKFATAYVPSDHPIHGFKERIRLAARPCVAPMDGAVEIEIRARFPRPKATSKKAPDRKPKITKPDVDNIAKAVLDALTGYAYFDDSQVSSLKVSKEIAALDELPATEITIRQYYKYKPVQ